MVSRLGAVMLLGGALSAACASEAMGPPPQLYGILMKRAVTTEDSVRVAGYGQVVALVRADSAFVLLTSVDYAQLAQLPGLRTMGPPLGSNATTGIGVVLGVAPAPLSLAYSIASAVGRADTSHALNPGVYTMVAANRLNELNGFPQITSLWLDIDPTHLTRFAH